MNKQTILVTLVFTLLFGASLYVNSARSNTSVETTQRTSVPESAEKWEYARLFMVEDEKVTWIAGNIYLGQGTTTIQNLIGLLGGQPVQPTTANLLNLIGSQGWELAWFNENSSERVWLFKRRTS